MKICMYLSLSCPYAFAWIFHKKKAPIKKRSIKEINTISALLILFSNDMSSPNTVAIYEINTVSSINWQCTPNSLLVFIDEMPRAAMMHFSRLGRNSVG